MSPNLETMIQLAEAEELTKPTHASTRPLKANWRLRFSWLEDIQYWHVIYYSRIQN